MNIILLFVVFVVTWTTLVWLFMLYIHFLYEKEHFRINNGKLELHHVWWGKYFGYK